MIQIPFLEMHLKKPKTNRRERLHPMSTTALFTAARLGKQPSHRRAGKTTVPHTYKRPRLGHKKGQNFNSRDSMDGPRAQAANTRPAGRVRPSTLF